MTDRDAPIAKVSAPAPASQQPVTVEVNLVEPILRDSGPIETLALRKPKAGELRGLNIKDLMTGDISAVIIVLPRISIPFITDAEAANMSTEDIAEIGGTIQGFFITQEQKAMFARMTGTASTN